jgi:hypothetical protein
VRLLSVTLSLLESSNLEKTYGKKKMFIKMKTYGKFESYLVASSNIDLESAIRCAYDLGSVDKIGDTDNMLGQFTMELTKRQLLEL